MNVLIIRHADAERAAASDFDRRLTEKGQKQSKRLASFLANLGVQPNVIFTSPLVRARETADPIAAELGVKKGPTVDGRIACGMTPEEACEILWDCDESDTIALVGHEPDLSTLVCYLTGMNNPGNVEMKKAAIALVELIKPGHRQGLLRWLIPPKLLP